MFDTLRAALPDEGIGRELLDVLQQACEAQGGTYRVQHAVRANCGFVVTLWDSVEMQSVKRGDVVHGGFAICHELNGETWGELRPLRLVCLNGQLGIWPEAHSMRFQSESPPATWQADVAELVRQASDQRQYDLQAAVMRSAVDVALWEQARLEDQVRAAELARVRHARIRGAIQPEIFAHLQTRMPPPQELPESVRTLVEAQRERAAAIRDARMAAEARALQQGADDGASAPPADVRGQGSRPGPAGPERSSPDEFKWMAPLLRREPRSAVDQLLEQRLLRPAEHEAVSFEYERAGDRTAYGLGNAVTWTAHAAWERGDARRALELERLGGEVMALRHISAWIERRSVSRDPAPTPGVERPKPTTSRR